MHRRGFLRGGAASLAAVAPWPLEFTRKKRPQGPPLGVTHFGTPRPFSFASLKALARSLSLTVYSEPLATLPPGIAKLSWDQWESITY